ncbi:MAG: hypothetical protein KJ069_17300 [Anaerolineae bacterium]|nr:hypothetical protein [Anaerolineae bacterium]
MIKHGPVDVVVLALGEPRFDGSILTELERQAATGTIRVLDAMVLFKQEDGQCWRVDLEDLSPDQKAKVGFIETGTRGLFDSDDADTLYEGMVPDSAVIALAIEHTWAVALVNAMADSGVEMALNFRVPAPIVDEAFASLPTTI